MHVKPSRMFLSTMWKSNPVVDFFSFSFFFSLLVFVCPPRRSMAEPGVWRSLSGHRGPEMDHVSTHRSHHWPTVSPHTHRAKQTGVSRQFCGPGPGLSSSSSQWLLSDSGLLHVWTELGPARFYKHLDELLLWWEGNDSSLQLERQCVCVILSLTVV